MLNRKTLIAAVCAAAVGLGGVSTAYADLDGPAPSADSAPAATQELSEQQIDELAKYLEGIYDGELVDSEGKFDHQGTTDKFGGAFADAVASELESLSSQSPTSSERPRVKRSWKSYGKCLMEAVGFGGLGNASQAFISKLKKRHFRDAAQYLTKQAAKRGLKVAGRGGVVGIAAGLAAGSVWCGFKEL
ncbi:hypothetical protein ACHBTE_15500 [Streptomyces sp. M41]|uniref:hypothetical protein n=1 Tax=Streptomyces sp. M41 TaxID=3059412 RepID=UPI00374D3C27